MATAEAWLDRVTGLNPDRHTGDPAPHKPLLLLVVLDLARENGLTGGRLDLTAELVFRFSAYWPVVAHRRNRSPDVRLPFHHLQSDGFWTAYCEDGRPSPHRRVTSFVQFASEFDALLADPTWCEKARQALIAKHFRPEERLALYEAQGIQPPSEEETQQYANTPSSQARERGREARFRINVVAAYGYTCALTGYRLMTLSAGTIVDAAHIHRFADSGNNELENGIALSKNAHWMFDNGLWTISDDFRVLVATGHFAEAGPDVLYLQRYHGCQLHLPADPQKRPGIQYVAWHRKNTFLGMTSDSRDSSLEDE
jgi:putative restriction endonuclease